MIGGMSAVSLVAVGMPMALAIAGAVAIAAVVGLAAREIRDRAGAARRRGDADHHHHRRVDLPAWSRAARVGQGHPRVAAALRRAADRVVRAQRYCRRACGCSASRSPSWRRCRGSSAGRASARRCSRPRTTASPRSSSASMSAVVLFASFGLAAALGAIAGVLIAPITFTSYDAGVMFGLKGFAAAILGGLGSFPGRDRRRPRARADRELRRGLRVVRVQGRHCVRASCSPSCSSGPMDSLVHCEPTASSRYGAIAARWGTPRTGGLAVLALVIAAAAARHHQQLLLRRRDPGGAECDRLRRAQSADRIRRADQSRARRLLRTGRLRLGPVDVALRLAAVARAGHGDGGRRARRVRRRPADPPAQGPLPRDGDPGPRHHRVDRASRPKTA